MILHDSLIIKAINYGTIKISPFDRANIQPASYDVTLGNEGKFFLQNDPIEVDKPIDMYPVDLTKTPYLNSMQFLLVSTVERITLNGMHRAIVQGKSSIGRLGLFTENAGYIDPGFDGQITLELFNAAPVAIKLIPGMKIAQVSFEQLSSQPSRLYGDPSLGSRYQGQIGATESRVIQDYMGK